MDNVDNHTPSPCFIQIKAALTREEVPWQQRAHNVFVRIEESFHRREGWGTAPTTHHVRRKKSDEVMYYQYYCCAISHREIVSVRTITKLDVKSSRTCGRLSRSEGLGSSGQLCVLRERTNVAIGDNPTTRRLQTQSPTMPLESQHMREIAKFCATCRGCVRSPRALCRMVYNTRRE